MNAPRGMNVRPMPVELGFACWKRSVSGAMPCENRHVSVDSETTAGCASSTRSSQFVPLRRAPTTKTTRLTRGLLLTPDPGPRRVSGTGGNGRCGRGARHAAAQVADELGDQAPLQDPR